MALDPNINRIKFLRSKVAGKKPTTNDIQEGELAINLVDRMLYTNDGTSIVDLGFSQGGPVNGNIDVKGNITATGTVKAPTFIGELTGNAATATKLKTPVKINNVDFDGSKNITIADDTKLAIASRPVPSSDMFIWRDIASLNFGGNQTGPIVIHFPKANRSSTTMFKMTVEGFNYQSRSVWAIEISGYNYPGPSWHSMQANSISGPCPFDTVTFGEASDHQVIVLGNNAIPASGNTPAKPATAYSYPMIAITKFMAHRGSKSGSGWADTTMAFETDLSPYTLNSPILIVGSDQAQRLTYARTFTFQGDTTGSLEFDGTQNVSAVLTTRAASTSAAGIVKLNNTLVSTSVAEALTANAGKVLQDTKVAKAGDTMTGMLTVPAIVVPGGPGGIGLFTATAFNWQMYMSAPGAGKGFLKNITAPAGTLATGSALRSLVGEGTGFGWTWETTSNTNTAPKIVAEMSSQTGEVSFSGRMYAPSIKISNPILINGVSTDLSANVWQIQQDAVRVNKDGDLNNCLLQGFWYCDSTADSRTIKNMPGTAIEAFSLRNERAAGVVQTLTYYENGTRWTRRYYSGNWSPWKQLFGPNMEGNIATADKWRTTSAFTIGNHTLNVDGSAASYTWSLASMGAVAKAGDTVTGALAVNGNLTAGSTLTLSGASGQIQSPNRLTVLNGTGPQGLTIGSIAVADAYATGNTEIAKLPMGSVYVKATTRTGVLIADTSATMNGTLTTAGAATFNGTTTTNAVTVRTTLTVTGATTLNGATNTNALTVRQNLGVVGTADVGGSLKVTGDISTINSVVSRTAIVGDSMAIGTRKSGVVDNDYTRIQLIPPTHLGTWGISVGDNASKAFLNIGYASNKAATFDSDGNTELLGVVRSKIGLGVMRTNLPSNSGAGISLYNEDIGGANKLPSYGFAFAETGTFQPFGHVTGDWATYFTMGGQREADKARGWIFRNYTNDNVFSVNAYGSVTANVGFSVNAPGGVANNFIKAGNGDAANYDTYNLAIGSHNGIGFVDRNGAANMVMDVRAGNFSAKGTITAYDLLATHDIKATGWIYAPKFVGNLQGKADNATLADRAINADGAVVAGRADSLAVNLQADRRAAMIATWTGTVFGEKMNSTLYNDSGPHLLKLIIEKNDVGDIERYKTGSVVYLKQGGGDATGAHTLTLTINHIIENNSGQWAFIVDWPNHGFTGPQGCWLQAIQSHAVGCRYDGKGAVFRGAPNAWRTDRILSKGATINTTAAQKQKWDGRLGWITDSFDTCILGGSIYNGSNMFSVATTRMSDGLQVSAAYMSVQIWDYI